VKLNLYLLEGIHDDIDFCCKLAKEESVILCPGEMNLIFFGKDYISDKNSVLALAIVCFRLQVFQA
jgi:hypothetical protein